MSDVALTSAAPAGTSVRTCELADIVRRYGATYRRTQRLTHSQSKTLTAIAHCRTAALGGQRHWCDNCGYQRYVYHSCRNRHCPKCQSTATAAWVQARTDELLPVPYFHQVFTLPHQLHGLLLRSERNRRALLTLLFDAAAQTLLAFGRGEFGGQIGFTLVLHTWDQQLRPHFHLHALVPSGALSPDGQRWIAGGRQFLFAVRGLSQMFRAKYLDGVAELLEHGALDLPPPLATLAETVHRRAWLRRLRKTPWVVYSQRPFAGPRKLIDYLGRYTHRTAIGKQRLLDCDDGQVRFTWRDRRDGDRRKVMTLPAEEFLRRFLTHVLPPRFTRIRHYGLLANRGKQQRLAHIRTLLGQRAPLLPAPPRPQTAAEWLRLLVGMDVGQCPGCGGPLACQRLAPLSEVAALPAAAQPATTHARAPWNTS